MGLLTYCFGLEVSTATQPQPTLAELAVARAYWSREHPRWTSGRAGIGIAMVERNQYPWRASEKHAEPVLATEDPRSMESAIDLIADGAERYASRASQRAQDLIWEAWETTGGAPRGARTPGACS